MSRVVAADTKSPAFQRRQVANASRDHVLTVDAGRDRLPPGDELQVLDLSVQYPGHRAVKDVSLEVARGECLALLGPSGCGKSTLLRAIAGLVRPSRGSIRMSGRVVADTSLEIFVPAEHRGVGMVFQDYALWPHLSVEENVAFPLQARGLPASERHARVRAALEQVRMGDLAGRHPAALSGGQQQRVSLARAIVARPRILLFDEPLSNLDAHLRAALAQDIGRLTREIGASAVYVTHDRSEAYGLADRVAVMSDGHLLQVAAPTTLHRHPVSAEVARFLRCGALLPGRASPGAFHAHPEAHGLVIEQPPGRPSGPADLLVFPDAIRLDPEGPIAARVQSCAFLGDAYEVSALLIGPLGPVTQTGMPATEVLPQVSFRHPDPLAPGSRIRLRVDPGSTRLFPSSPANGTPL